MTDEQLLFDLFAGNEPDSETSVDQPNSLILKQTILGFLAAGNPAGLALNVPAKFQKYQVAAAAYWCDEHRKVRQVSKTVLVELYTKREHCFIDCATGVKLAGEIRELGKRREQLESKIRKTEPELRSTNDLFSEYCTWNYRQSRNAEYQQLRRHLSKLQTALQKGTRLERIKQAAVADYLYLAVPYGLIAPDEIDEDWGLLYLDADRQYVVVREPELQNPEQAGRLHLALTIGQCERAAMLFSQGVNVLKSGKMSYSRPPRRRRK